MSKLGNTMHQFNIYIAKEFGVNTAIILSNMMFWLEKNEANNINFHKDKYWTYNSISAYAEIFPYLSERQIRYVLDNLEKDNIIISDNFNKAKFDKTKWYTISDYGREYIQSVMLVYTKCTKELHKMYTPIPDVNTDSKQVPKDIVEKDSTLPYKEIVDYLNKTAGRQYKHTTNITKSNIKARFNEGFTLTDFFTVIDTKVAEWSDDDKMSMYIRPETLFSNKFEGYLNQQPTKQKKSEYDDITFKGSVY